MQDRDVSGQSADQIPKRIIDFDERWSDQQIAEDDETASCRHDGRRIADRLSVFAIVYRAPEHLRRRHAATVLKEPPRRDQFRQIRIERPLHDWISDIEHGNEIGPSRQDYGRRAARNGNWVYGLDGKISLVGFFVRRSVVFSQVDGGPPA